MTKTVAELIVQCLEQQGVEYIFGIPGAKIDAVFNALVDSSIKVITCRHEQNAAFMAAQYGRLTGKPGVVLVTSGPGVGNLCTGLLTATTEGDPVIALAGNVPRDMHFKESHQSADNVELLQAATKHAVEINSQGCVAEQISNAFRHALMPRRGACFLSFPQDLLKETTDLKPLNVITEPVYGCADADLIDKTIQLINQAKNPVLLLGEDASMPHNAKAINRFLQKNRLPVVGTYQAAGVISHDNIDCFVGRVGLFKNQPGDLLLEESDLVITVGFNPAEYDPETWNGDNHTKVIHLSYIPADIHFCYVPCVELLGDIATTINSLSSKLQLNHLNKISNRVKQCQKAYFDLINSGKNKVNKNSVHPLAFIDKLRQTVSDDDFICCDIGSNYMWMARYFLCFKPHHLTFSNVQQTLGVALPHAMVTRLIHPDREIISISGDGGFLFSATELETAVRENLKFIHFVWTDGTYDMVRIQEIMKYNRPSSITLGCVDIVEYAKAFGATGLRMQSITEFDDIMEAARRAKGPVIINVAIDYSDNEKLIELKDPHHGH